MRTDTPQPIRLADYRPPAFLVDEVHLTFDLKPSATRVKARLQVRRNGEHADPLTFNGERLKPISVAIDGRVLADGERAIDGEFLVIPNAPDAFTLETEVEIDPQANKALDGLYMSAGRFCTQCEAEGFRKITFWPDRPDVLSRFTVRIEADQAYPRLLSNGNLMENGALPGGRRYAVWNDPFPKPCYLFALVAGELDVLEDKLVTMSGRTVDLRIYVDPGMAPRAAYAMDALKRAMKWDEEAFGREYDLDLFMIVAVRDFNFGAMENKGLNIFNSSLLLADPATATDMDFERIEGVVAHEYFHNWTGDRITCRDWFQLSLKEGLTVFRDQSFSADMRSAGVKRIEDVKVLRMRQFQEDAGPLAHPVQPQSYIAIDNFYTATIYNKGAEVIRMMATIIGRENFRRGMDLYFERHDNQAVTIDDFAQAMQDASGVDLTRFKRWYHQAGTPEVTVYDKYDAAEHRYTLTLSQRTPPTPGQPDKQPLVIPIAMGLLDTEGKEIAARMLLLTEAEQSFTFDEVLGPPVPSLLRGFSAPVKLAGVKLEQLRFLAAHDTDPFVRWESGQQYATYLMLEMAAAWRRGEKPGLEQGVIDALAATLRGADTDPAFAAEALVLPGEAFLADQMEIADVDAIHAVRDAARAAIGRALRAELRAAYDRLTDAGEYRIDGNAIGRRSLRNACLGYLAANGEAEGVALAKAQFDAAQNMTDVLAALAVLSAIDCPERQYALDAFHARWRKDDLVLDKWFAIQAMSPLPDTPRAVRALASHADYDLKNPNRVRALVSSFASGNQVRFHDSSGSGYGFLAETIIQLDPMNSQVAARLVPPLGQWRRMAPARRALMKQELQRILDAPGLSKGTYEMATRSIA
jgi:aminopeptidase N